MPYFDQHYFDELVVPDAEKTPADTIAVVENIGYSAICEWYALGDSSLADALGYTHGINLLVKEEAGAVVLFVAYQAGVDGAGGLVFRASADLGYTWDAEVVIDAKANVHACSVINPSTYNIHLIYGQTGDPTMDAAHSAWYRVLAWGGATWAIGVEKTLALGSGSEGYGNLSMEHRSGNFMALCCLQDSGNDRFVHSIKAISSWDFQNPNKDSEWQLLDGVEIVSKLVRNDDDDEWYAIVEQGGDFRLYESKGEVTPPGEVTLYLKHTWYEASTPQFDACYNSTLGVVGIVQNDAGNIIYYEYDPSDDSLTGPTTLDSTTPSFWPAISNDRDRFVIVYARTVAGNQRELVAQWSDLPGVVIPFATDPVAEAWGHIKIARSTQWVDGVFLCWCDTVDSAVDGHYEVYYGRLHIRTMRDIAETISATDYVQNLGVPSDDAAAVTEWLHATEAKSIADAVGVADAIEHGPQVAETISVADAIVAAGILFPETILVTDVIEQLNRAIADAVTVTDAIGALVQQIALADTVAATDAIATVGNLLEENVAVADAVGAFLVTLAEAVAVGDAAAVSFTLTDTAAVADATNVAPDTVAEVISVDDLMGMVYQILETVGVADVVVLAPDTIAETVGVADTLAIEIPLADTVGVADALSKVSFLRLTVRLHMVGATPTLRIEGSSVRGIVAR